MADNKDTDAMLAEMGDLGDLGDLDSLLGDDLSFGVSEFDGLMDLEDFEALGSADGFLDIDSEWASDLEQDPASDLGQVEDLLMDTSLDEALTVDDISSETMDLADLLGQPESHEEPEMMDTLLDDIPVAEPQEMQASDFIDLDAMAVPDEELADIPYKDDIEDLSAGDVEIEDILSIGGAALHDSADTENIEQANEELRLDIPELDEKPQKKTAKEKKKRKEEDSDKVSIWQKLFGNVPDENYAKNAAKEAERQALKEAKKAAKKTKEEIEQEKQEKQKEKDEAAAAKKAEKDAKKAQKEEAKKLKLAEKAAARELEEAAEPPTRINRVGAGIILATFAVIAVVIVVGNNTYAYSQSIAKAQTYFGLKEYTNAYNQIYGVNVKEDDEELKSQVMTVMFVEKQLNSFDNYFAMEMYPEALDSLLKGLDKYDKYLEQARSLGIESDINYVKEKILEELKSAFNISEKKAYRLLQISDIQEYTEAVIKASGV